MSTATSALSAPRQSYGRIPIKVGAAVLAADQASKILARNLLPPGAKIGISDNICLKLYTNLGGVFDRPFDTPTKIAMTAALFSLSYLFIKAKSKITKLATSFLISGVIGNLTSRIIFGGVTDFMKLGPLYFNVADVALHAGNYLLLYEIFTKPTESNEHPSRIGILRNSFTKNILNTILQTALYMSALWCLTGYTWGTLIPALLLSLTRDVRRRGERMF